MSRIASNVIPLRQRAGKRYTNKRYLEHLATLPCLVCGVSDVQLHHLMRPWDGERGTGRRSGDQNAIPLCYSHHAKLHAAGDEYEFFKAELDDANGGRRWAEKSFKDWEKGT